MQGLAAETAAVNLCSAGLGSHCSAEYDWPMGSASSVPEIQQRFWVSEDVLYWSMDHQQHKSHGLPTGNMVSLKLSLADFESPCSRVYTCLVVKVAVTSLQSAACFPERSAELYRIAKDFAWHKRSDTVYYQVVSGGSHRSTRLLSILFTLQLR